MTFDNSQTDCRLPSYILTELETSNAAVADEIRALQAIFGEDKITLLQASDIDNDRWKPGRM